jgi:hypothetical protein
LEATTTTERRRYLAYMLRLWQVGSGEELAWRASLENPHTGERRGFASLETLVEFLEKETRTLPPRPDGSPRTRQV